MGWYRFLIGTLLQLPRKCKLFMATKCRLAFIKPSTRILKSTTIIGLNRYRLSFTASFILIRTYSGSRKRSDLNIALKWRRKNLANQFHFCIHPFSIIWVPLEPQFYSLFKNKVCCCDKRNLTFTPTSLPQDLPVNLLRGSLENEAPPLGIFVQP